MLRNIDDMEKYDVQASDGSIGQARDFFFDDESWVVRYVVVETGSWLTHRKVLISPISVGQIEATRKTMTVLLTRDQVKHSPDVDTDMPVSRQHEVRYLDYYGYPYYWGGGGLWAAGAFPSLMLSDIDSREGEVAYEQQVEQSESRRQRGLHNANKNQARDKHADDQASRSHDDPHLRSCKAVVGYKIQATEGLIGNVCGFIVDEDTWALRYMVVQTGHWWSGHKVLIAPAWIRSVNWFDNTVTVELSRADVKASPHFESTAELDHEKEAGLYKHYDRRGYWINPL